MIWEVARANSRRAAGLVAIETLILAGLGAAIGEAMARGGAAYGIGAGCAIALVLFLVAFAAGDQVLVALSGGREVRREHHSQLLNVVEEMQIASGMAAMPRVYLIEDDAPNAFACGRSPRSSAVCVTSGLLKRLSRDELQGVVGHEIGHIVNRDILYATLVSVMVGAVAILSQVFLRSTRFGATRSRTSRGREGGGGQAIVILIAVVLAILAPIVARLVFLAISRRREYLADASSALFTRYPEGLASALEKIASSRQPLASSAPALEPLYIIPAERRSLIGDNLWSTHPPTERRIAILRSMGGTISYRAYQDTFARLSRERPLFSRQALATGPETTARGASAAAPPPPAAPAEAPAPLAPADARDRVAAAEEARDRHREATDLVWRTQGRVFKGCPCGLNFKIPRDLTTPFRCPRCGTPVAAGGDAPRPQR